MALVAALAGSGAAQGPERPSREVEATIPFPPSIVRLETHAQLTYEVQVTNAGRTPYSVVALDVLGSDARLVARYDASALRRMAGGAPPAPDGGGAALPAGARLVLYVDAPLREPIPGGVSHRLALLRDHGSPGRDTIHGVTLATPIVAVDHDELPPLGAPLAGGPWVAVYAPALERGHRRVAYSVDGRTRIPGRFAVDWFRVDRDGRLGEPPLGRLTDHLAYGADVLAVADGVVAAARDGVREPERLRDLSRVPPEAAAGNFVALRIGPGRYAVYEHLRPGLRVRPGDRVRRGQVIASLGLTGQGSAPHLHFHVADAPEPLAGEGRPFRIASYEMLGRYEGIEAFGAGTAWTPERPVPVRDRMPSAMSVVRFPER